MDIGGGEYICRAGESFDLLALNIYGDEKFVSELLNENPALCRRLVFHGGERIRLPMIDIPEGDADGGAWMSAAPWKA